MSIQSQVRNPLAASRQAAVARLGQYSRAHVAGVSALTIVIAAIYSVFSLILYRTFKDTNYDLVIFDQAIRSYSHFHLAISPIKGMHDGNGMTFSVLGDHFSPIIAALAPLYWIYGSPQTLLVAQAILFALAIPPLWIFARRAFGGSGGKAATAAYLICVAYGLCWPLVAAAHYDFHEVAFAPVLTAIALERFQAGRLRSALIAVALLLLVKEDMGLLVVGIGAYLVLSFPNSVRRQPLVGIGLIVLGFAYTAFATYVLIPAFGGFGDYYWAYSALGSNVPQVAEHIVRHPVATVRRLIHPSIKFHTLKWLFGAFCFLSLLSPVVLAAVPLLLERMLNSKYPNWWVLAFQYNAYLAIPLACAAADGAARLDRWVTAVGRAAGFGSRSTASAPAAASLPEASSDQGLPVSAPETVVPAQAGPVEDGAAPVRSRRSGADRQAPRGTVSLICSIAICGVVLYMVPMYKLGAMLHPWFYHQTYQTRSEAAAVAKVPSGVVVEAANDLGSELSARDTVLMWDGDGVTPPFAAPWVVADVHRHEFTFDSMTEQRDHVTNLLQHGYKVVFRRDGYLVLHRPGPADLSEPKGPLATEESG
ncbi:MAG TPA: DUF2079 domain-containing protein [Streptosporangiaceae bacterium]|jgi:uncharacterized membrane protein